jgi:hypothetical protein
MRDASKRIILSGSLFYAWLLKHQYRISAPAFIMASESRTGGARFRRRPADPGVDFAKGQRKDNVAQSS